MNITCPHCGKPIDQLRQKEYSNSSGGRQKKKMYSIDVEVEYVTDKALKVTDNPEYDGVFLPKSQIRYQGDIHSVQPGDEITIEIPEWLAKDKGFIGGEISETQDLTDTKPDTPIKSGLKKEDDIPF